MADDAHDASGHASPKPGDIAPQQASRAASADEGKLRVFISYSRDDLEFANQLDAALKACGFECSIDREGISGGEKWKQRLSNLISEADTVVFGSRRPWRAPKSAPGRWRRRHDLASASFPLSADRWRARVHRRGCGTSTTFFSMRTQRYWTQASAPASKLWSQVLTPNCANTPATFSARPSGTAAVGQQTGCCQAMILLRQKTGR